MYKFTIEINIFFLNNNNNKNGDDVKILLRNWEVWNLILSCNCK